MIDSRSNRTESSYHHTILGACYWSTELQEKNYFNKAKQPKEERL